MRDMNPLLTLFCMQQDPTGDIPHINVADWTIYVDFHANSMREYLYSTKCNWLHDRCAE